MMLKYINVHSRFTKIDKGIISNLDLSDGAYRLYCYLIGLMPGCNINEKAMAQALNVGLKTITNRKKELIKHGLLLVKKLAPGIYIGYLGTSQKNAYEVKKEIEAEEKLIMLPRE